MHPFRICPWALYEIDAHKQRSPTVWPVDGNIVRCGRAVGSRFVALPASRLEGWNEGGVTVGVLYHPLNEQIARALRKRIS